MAITTNGLEQKLQLPQGQGLEALATRVSRQLRSPGVSTEARALWQVLSGQMPSINNAIAKFYSRDEGLIKYNFSQAQTILDLVTREFRPNLDLVSRLNLTEARNLRVVTEDLINKLLIFKKPAVQIPFVLVTDDGPIKIDGVDHKVTQFDNRQKAFQEQVLSQLENGLSSFSNLLKEREALLRLDADQLHTGVQELVQEFRGSEAGKPRIVGVNDFVGFLVRALEFVMNKNKQGSPIRALADSFIALIKNTKNPEAVRHEDLGRVRLARELAVGRLKYLETMHSPTVLRDSRLQDFARKVSGQFVAATAA